MSTHCPADMQPITAPVSLQTHPPIMTDKLTPLDPITKLANSGSNSSKTSSIRLSFDACDSRVGESRKLIQGKVYSCTVGSRRTAAPNTDRCYDALVSNPSVGRTASGEENPVWEREMLDNPPAVSSPVLQPPAISSPVLQTINLKGGHTLTCASNDMLPLLSARSSASSDIPADISPLVSARGFEAASSCGPSEARPISPLPALSDLI